MRKKSSLPRLNLSKGKSDAKKDLVDALRDYMWLCDFSEPSEYLDDFSLAAMALYHAVLKADKQ